MVVPRSRGRGTGAEDVRPDVPALVERTHPAIYAAGLPRTQAIWFAVAGDGSITRSWIGPNLYINFHDYAPLPLPNRALGIARDPLAAERHKRLLSEVLQANVPDMRIGGSYYSYQGVENGAHFVTHFLTEAPTGQFAGATAVDEAIRKSLAEVTR